MFIFLSFHVFLIFYYFLYLYIQDQDVLIHIALHCITIACWKFFVRISQLCRSIWIQEPQRGACTTSPVIVLWMYVCMFYVLLFPP